MNEIVFAILIYFFTLLIALWGYILLVKRMKTEDIYQPPIFSLFFTVLTYTITILATISPLFYGIIKLYRFDLSYVYLSFPIIMSVIAAINHGKRHFSSYHVGVYRASLIYIFMVPVFLFLYVLTLFWY